MPRRDVRQRADLGRLDPSRESLELEDAGLGGARACSRPAPRREGEETVAVRRHLQRPRLGHDGDVLAVVGRVQKDVPDRAVEGVDALDEGDQLAAAELPEQARGEQGDLVLRLQLALVLELAALGPGRKEQRQDEDRDQERRREQQDRLEPGRQPLAGGEPDDHLAVPVPAGQRQQHGHEQRDREQNIEVEQGVEAEQREDSLGRHGAAGRPSQQPQHQVGEQDPQQDDEHPDRRGRELSDQAAPENHDGGRILTFSGGFADNAAGIAPTGKEKTQPRRQGWRWNLP